MSGLSNWRANRRHRGVGACAGNAFAPNFAAVTDDGTTVEDEDGFDAESFGATCRDDIASQRFLVLVLAIAGTGALVIGVSSREQLPSEPGSPGSAHD